MSPKTKSDPLAPLALVEPRWPAPTPLDDADLLMQGLMCVLVRRLSQSQAEGTIRALRAGYPDWNEPRVAQVQELAPLVKSRSTDAQLQVAADVKTYLQEIYQKNHGFDLEFLREDLATASKFVQQLEFLGLAGGHYVLWLASDRALPITTGIIRVLDRLGVMGRTGALKKAQGELTQLVPQEDRVRFALAYGEIVERWCDPRKPICWECVLVEICPHGKKVYKEWEAQQKRLEAHRKRDEARAEVQRTKDEARRKRDEERERKRREAEEQKRAREKARQDREEQRKRERDEAERERAAARKKADVEKAKAAAAKKKAEDKKAAAAKKSKTKTKSARKKPTTKPSTTKRSATKRPATKRPATKRPATKRPATKRPAAKPSPTKRPASKKKATKKPAPKSSTKRGSASKKKSTSGGSSSKSTRKRPATSGGSARKTSRKSSKRGR